jgi:hypothetical protein
MSRGERERKEQPGAGPLNEKTHARHSRKVLS